MNEISDTLSRGDTWRAIKWILLAALLSLVAYLALHVVGVIGAAASAPGRVVTKTLATDNIIASYEWFYDANAQYNARVNQAKAHASLVAAETDPKERSRLNIELAAIRQSCRDLTTKYNANSEKANKSLFKSNGLPDTLSINTCEV